MTAKYRILSVLSAEKTVCHRGEGHVADPQFLQHREQFFIPSCHHGIPVLNRSHRANGVRATDGIFFRLGQTPMDDFSLPDQFCHDPSHFLNGNLRVRPVLIVKVNVVCLQPLQGTLYRRANHFRTGIRHDRQIDRIAAPIKVNAKLGGNDHLIPVGLQSRSHQFLIVMGTLPCPIGFRRVKKGAALIHGLCNQLCHLPFVCRRSVGMCHTHAA